MRGRLACVASRVCAPSARPYAPLLAFVVYGDSGDCAVSPGRPVSGLRAPRAAFVPVLVIPPSWWGRVYRGGASGFGGWCAPRQMVSRRVRGVLRRGASGRARPRPGELRRPQGSATAVSSVLGRRHAGTIVSLSEGACKVRGVEKAVNGE
eukprot:5237155-Pyramimonas_sp.AAC.1